MHQLILAGNAETHPAESFVIGIIVVAVAVVFIFWLLGKIFK